MLWISQEFLLVAHAWVIQEYSDVKDILWKLPLCTNLFCMKVQDLKCETSPRTHVKPLFVIITNVFGNFGQLRRYFISFEAHFNFAWSNLKFWLSAGFMKKKGKVNSTVDEAVASSIVEFIFWLWKGETSVESCQQCHCKWLEVIDCWEIEIYQLLSGNHWSDNRID